MVPFGGFANGIVAAARLAVGLAGALDVHGALSLGVAAIVFTFFFVDFFDATGTLVGLATRAGYLDETATCRARAARSRRTAWRRCAGALLGTSTTTAYIESASGIADGGRTGLTALAVAVLFAVSTALWPLASVIPAAATAPALILVGALMLEGLRDVEWDDYAVSIPVFLTIVAMPLTFSIANGVSFGVISYAAIKLFSGRGREVDPLLYASPRCSSRARLAGRLTIRA